MPPPTKKCSHGSCKKRPQKKKNGSNEFNSNNAKSILTPGDRVYGRSGTLKFVVKKKPKTRKPTPVPDKIDY